MVEKGKCRESCYVEEVSSMMASQALGEQKGHGICIELKCLTRYNLDTAYESVTKVSQN